MLRRLTAEDALLLRMESDKDTHTICIARAIIQDGARAERDASCRPARPKALERQSSPKSERDDCDAEAEQAEQDSERLLGLGEVGRLGLVDAVGVDVVVGGLVVGVLVAGLVVGRLDVVPVRARPVDVGPVDVGPIGAGPEVASAPGVGLEDLGHLGGADEDGEAAGVAHAEHGKAGDREDDEGVVFVVALVLVLVGLGFLVLVLVGLVLLVLVALDRSLLLLLILTLILILVLLLVLVLVGVLHVLARSDRERDHVGGQEDVPRSGRRCQRGRPFVVVVEAGVLGLVGRW